MFLPCRPCCGGGSGCNDPIASPNKPVTDPAAEGEWVPSGTWGFPTPAPSGNTYDGITWTFVPNTSGTGGSTWFFYGSQETSNATGTATLAEQKDWDNICNWYSSSNVAPFYYHSASPDPKTRLDKRASTLPTAGATIHFYSTPDLSTPRTCSVAYFHLGEVESGGTLTTTGTAIDSPGGAVFMTGGSTYAIHPGGVQGTYNGSAHFRGRSRLYGTANGDQLFGGGSGLYGGTVNGNVTVSQGATNSGITYGTTSTINGNLTSTVVSGNHSFLHITGTTGIAGGTFIECVSDGALSVTAGGFGSYCGSTVSVTGTGGFNGGCVGHLTANTTGIVKSDYAYTIPTATLSGSTVAQTQVRSGSSWGTVDCYDNVIFFGTVTGKLSMYDTTRISGNTTGDVDLYDSAIIGGNSFSTAAQVTGTVVFNGSSSLGRDSDSRGGKVLGTATFNDSSECAGYGWVNGNATFNDTTVCRGYCGQSSQGYLGLQTGVVTFNNSACCTLLYTSATPNLCPSSGYVQQYWSPTAFVSTGLSCSGSAPAWYCNTTDTCGCG